jgi:hypothetical protein
MVSCSLYCSACKKKSLGLSVKEMAKHVILTDLKTAIAIKENEMTRAYIRHGIKEKYMHRCSR